jgi:endonuclease YncB( thermonuclease family)
LLAICLPSIVAQAAKPKPLEKLTAFTYVDDKNNDGDSFRVKCADKEFVLRLYFIDAPETSLRFTEQTRKQSQYFGIALDETLAAGTMATDFVRTTLKDPFEVWTKWSPGGGQSKEGRYSAFVEVKGRSLIELMVSGGWARVSGYAAPLPDGQKSPAYKKRLLELEGNARRERLGAWANSKGKS